MARRCLLENCVYLAPHFGFSCRLPSNRLAWLLVEWILQGNGTINPDESMSSYAMVKKFMRKRGPIVLAKPQRPMVRVKLVQA